MILGENKKKDNKYKKTFKNDEYITNNTQQNTTKV